ncbi:MAG: hypothetical protein J5701_01625 [Bacteroidales bacterium]|nr:hypothetical protein [Bacteroidales bacterium]
MNTAVVIAISVLPALLVACTACYTLKLSMEKELRALMLNFKQENKKIINPIRLQAYERIALFLERIRPESLLLRVSSSDLSAVQYRILLLANIRSEFEHNLSQQVYISGLLWQTTKTAKEDLFKIINLAAGKVDGNATGADLAAKILELNIEQPIQPIDQALDLLRKEITELY